MQVVDVTKVNKEHLKALGSSGTMIIGSAVQSIFGPLSENYKTAMDEYIKAGGTGALMGKTGAPVDQTPSVATVQRKTSDNVVDVSRLLRELGGRDNIGELGACATTRLRLSIREKSKVDWPGLRDAGVLASVEVSDGLYHLIVGWQAEAVAAAKQGIYRLGGRKGYDRLAEARNPAGSW